MAGISIIALALGASIPEVINYVKPAAGTEPLASPVVERDGREPLLSITASSS